MCIRDRDTISKKYDHTFKDIFQEVYDTEYKAKFEAAGITYFYSLIDDIVSRDWSSDVCSSDLKISHCFKQVRPLEDYKVDRHDV